MVSASDKKVKRKMKGAKIQIIIWFFAIVTSIALYKYFTAKSDLQVLAETGVKDEVLAFIRQQNADLLEEKTKLQREEISLKLLELKRYQAKARLDIERVKLYADISLYGICFLIGCTGLSGIIFVLAIYRERVKRASVHTYQIGQYNTIVVHERDLSIAAPIAMSLANAQELKEINGGIDKAFELYQSIAAVQQKQLAKLAQDVLPEQAQEAIDVPVRTPTFRELLESREISPGRPLIFGYRKDTGNPERGKLHDQYSCVAIGMSGGGKTNFLAFLVGQSVLAERAYFDILDVHYPSPESLGASLGALRNTPFVRVNYNAFLLPGLLAEWEKELDRRLANPKAVFTPYVIVVDEHERWVKKDGFVAFETRVVNEGRKVKIYLFVTSKSAKADKIGDSALRDNCVTSYCFQTKTHNARTFFKDEEKVKLVKQLRAPGDAIYTNRKDESFVVGLPFAEPEDMEMICEQLKVANGQNLSSETFRPVDKCGVLGVDKMAVSEIQPPSNVVKFQRVEKTEVNEKSTAIQPVDKKNEETQKIIEKLRKDINEKRTTLGEISRQVKVDKAWLSKIINGGKTELMSENIRRKLSELCEVNP
jgi:hypothetical protein